MTRSRFVRVTLAAAVASASLLGQFISGSAAAHDGPTRGYSRITAEGDTLTWTLYFDPRYLDTFMHLDTDGNGTVGDEEIDARRGDIGDMVLPAVWVSDETTGEEPMGSLGEVGLVDFSATGLHSEGFADLDDFPLVAVPVGFTFADMDVEHVQVTYDLFVLDAFGEHINIAEVDVAESSNVFEFDPGIPSVVIGDVIAGTAPRDGAVSADPADEGADDHNLAPLALGSVTVVLAIGFALRQRFHSRRGTASNEQRSSSS